MSDRKNQSLFAPSLYPSSGTDFFSDMESSFRDMSLNLSSPFPSHEPFGGSPVSPSAGRDSRWMTSPSHYSPMDRSVPSTPLRSFARPAFSRPMPVSGNSRMAVLESMGSATTVWSGTLPPRNAKESSFSCKVFLGGVPWDITEADLMNAFGKFGPLRVEWPGIHDRSTTQRPKGHLYLIFDQESSVKFLLGSCSYDFHHGQHNWFYRVSSKRMLVKSVQVIPWQLADATYSVYGYVPTHGSANKIFVANLHGMVTAEGLARIMNDLFGGVVAATLDTDKTKYPIGSGRITFSNWESHMKAIRSGTVEIRTAKFTRQIKIDPYLEDSPCSMCNTQHGPFFCRDLQCFSYFCYDCWRTQHQFVTSATPHLPMVRPARAPVEETV